MILLSTIKNSLLELGSTCLLNKCSANCIASTVVPIFGRLESSFIELLTLQSPFRGKNSATIFSQILKGELHLLANAVPTFQTDWKQICLRCLSRRMAQRFQSARQLLVELEAVEIEPESLDSIPSTKASPHLPAPQETMASISW